MIRHPPKVMEAPPLKLNAGCRAGLVSLPLLFHPVLTRAGEGGATGPYQVEWRRELPILALAGIASATPEFLSHELGGVRCPCSKDGINPLDRGVAGRNSEGADRASDVAAGFLLAAPFALDAADVHRSSGGRSGFISDAIVMFETFAVDGGLNRLVKAAVHRPRPFLYGLPAGDPAFDQADNYRSFYSAHVSTVFATGLSYARTFALRHPESPSRRVVYGAAILGGTTVAALRAAAGRHFPTDVLTGAVVGSAVGLAVPALHHPRALTTFSVLPYDDGAMLLASFPIQ